MLTNLRRYTSGSLTVRLDSQDCSLHANMRIFPMVSAGYTPRARGPGRIRTDNLVLAKHPLYRWSYKPIPTTYYIILSLLATLKECYYRIKLCMSRSIFLQHSSEVSRTPKRGTKLKPVPSTTTFTATRKSVTGQETSSCPVSR